MAVVACLPCLALLAGKYPLDLDVYRAGGRAVLHGRDLYAVRLGRYGFTYPPFAALVLSPLAAVPLPVATLLLTAASVAALAGTVRLCAPRWVAAVPSPVAVAALAALLACQPVRLTLLNGQVNLLLMVVVLLDVLVLRRGMLVGLAAAVKLTPAVFVLYLLATGRGREARTAALSFVGATALAAVVLPGDSLRFWTSQVFGGSGIGDTARPDNESVWGVLHRLCGPHAAGALWLIASSAVLAGGLAWARRESLRPGGAVAACGVVGVTGCLVSPVSWTHHWVWCIPLLAGLAVRATGADRWWLGGAAGFFGVYRMPAAAWSVPVPVVSTVIAEGYLLIAVLLWWRFGRARPASGARASSVGEESVVVVSVAPSAVADVPALGDVGDRVEDDRSGGQAGHGDGEEDQYVDPHRTHFHPVK